METSIVLIFLSVLAVSYYFIKRQFSFWQRYNVPFVKPVFPYGNLKDVGKKFHLCEMLMKFYNENKHRGPFVGLYFFLSPVVLLTDLDLVKSVMSKDFSVFQERHFYHNEKDDPLSAHLFAIDGTKWKNLRTKLTPTFTSGKMKFMFSTVLEIGERLSERLNTVVNESANQCAEIELKNYWARYTTDVIGSCAFGLECNTLNDKDALFREMGRQVFEEPRRSMGLQLLVIQLKEWANYFGIKQLPDKPAEFFLKIVKETVAYRELNKVGRKDFMHLLIDLKNSSNTELSTITENEIAAQAFVFFIAGFETSSTLLSFCSYELSQDQEIQEKIRNEVKNVLKQYNGEFTYDAMLEMKYLDQVLKEALRKYPPLATLTRGATEDYWVKDNDGNKLQLIPKGSTVYIPVYAIHHDPDVYPDPKRFNPDRFLPEEESKRHPYSYLPFGEGPRVCIGLRFGMMQARIGLAKTLLNFKLSLGSNMNGINFSKKQNILSNEGGIWIKLEKINEIQK
ncbi:probable cytochrome P450 6a14 [Bradysia coprophila]|uniref:probable cytochrome P450 6a14 n=1 Tax=Bradysia coprophila TaxID=38358 RepID=UPI00187DBDB1|nr:probable cytochrome P450 6a14 [Bradysia coprophila]